MRYGTSNRPQFPKFISDLACDILLILKEIINQYTRKIVLSRDQFMQVIFMELKSKT